MFPLSQIKQSDRVTVLYIPPQCPLKPILEPVGFRKGCRLYCQYLSPGGDLAALEMEGILMALRRKDLHTIMVRYDQ